MSRCHFPARLALVSLATGLLFAPSLVAADFKESKDAVKITATADKPNAEGLQTVTIAIDIQQPWHLYANPVRNEDMVGSQTVVKLSQAGKNLKPEDVKIKYPAGREVKDPTAGTYWIYEGKVEITAVVQRGKEDTAVLEVAVQLSACDESKCLLPSNVKLKAEAK
jgi:hypothetical protein